MSGFGNKISKKMKATSKAWRADVKFSPYYAWLRVCEDWGASLRLRKLSAGAYDKRNQWIQDYLYKKMKPILDQLEADGDTGTPAENGPVWVCWWTGEETAPALVRKCIDSIRRHANGHPVHFISKENYSDYLTVPQYILDKMEANQICLAHFADYLRFSLLAKYGGLWLDATIFCTAALPEEIFNMPVFTCKGRTGEGKYISDYRWTTFCIGGYGGNVLFRYIQAAFERYLAEHDSSIDYLMLDHLIALGYKHISTIGRCLDAVPVTNIHRDDLQAAMNAALPAEAMEEILKPETTLYKLSWREQYLEKTPDGRLTIYGAFIQ